MSYEIKGHILGFEKTREVEINKVDELFSTLLDKASGRYLNEIYMLAWKLGLKSTYYLRSQSPESSNDVEDRSMECVGCQ